MLCVASVTPDKGHGVLLDALQMLSDLTWQCVCVGRLDRDPGICATAAPKVTRCRVG